ncbi:MAG: hypothetical protein KC503_07045 [Myxococcales bacterium]|nr:hypothetical protein [Myxococcales bacterium]
MHACATFDSTSSACVHAGHDAYRGASIRPLCGVCNHTTTDGIACPRCSTPLCTEHATTAGERCGACEATYTRLLDDRRADPLPTWTLPLIYVASSVGAALLVPLVAAATRSVALASLSGLAVACLPLAVGWFRKRRLRPRFLRETPSSRSLQVNHVPLPAEPKPKLPISVWGVASFVTSLVFFIPLLPLAAIVFGGLSVRDQGLRDTTLGRTGLIVGIVMLGMQAMVFGLAMMCRAF